MSRYVYAGFSSTSFLTLRQVKARTGLSRAKIDALVEAGTFFRTTSESNEIWFCGTHVDEWMDAQIALDLSKVQRRAYTQVVLKAVGEQNESTKYCAVGLFLKRGILDSSGKQANLSRAEVSELLRSIFSMSEALVGTSEEHGRDARPLCFPILSQTNRGGWTADFLLEMPSMIDDREFVEKVMTLWRKSQWSTDTWSVEVLKGRDEVHGWFKDLLDVAIDDGTVDQSNLYIPHDARYALFPPTVVDPAW